MTYFKIYAGLSGGFGGANYIVTRYFNDADEAMDYAYSEACEIYDNYAGLHGLLDWDEVSEELVERFGKENISDEDINTAYIESRESWLDYHVEEADGEDDINE